MDGIPYLLGCVPWFTYEGHLAELAAQPNIEIGVHGWKHERGEFEGLKSLGALVEKVQRARRLLAGSVPVWVPPFNWMSASMVEALDQADYEAFTTGPETSADALTYLARSERKIRAVGAPWYGRASEFVTRWRAGERLGQSECLALHWTWEANQKNGFQAVRELVGLMRSEVVSWKEAGVYR